MRHRIAGSKLSRAVKPRRALFRSLIASFIRHGELKISLAKAKAIRPLVDKLVTQAKKATLASQHQIQGVLQNQELTQKLVRDLAPKFGRKSGFIKITRLPTRKSDSSKLAKIEWSEKMIPQKKQKTTVKPVEKKEAQKKIAKTQPKTKPAVGKVKKTAKSKVSKTK